MTIKSHTSVTGSKRRGLDSAEISRAVNKDIVLILLRKSAKKTRITESSSFFIGFDVMQP